MTTVAALCAGYGGLELGLSLAGVDHELAWWAELDPHAATVMAAHTTAPNLGDLCAITDPPPVDIVTAGFPCQPVSQAGQRRGVDDDRWLIEDVCRVARSAGARWLVLENVAGLLTANDGDAMARVCAAMAETGFSRWEWTTLRASDVGACHQRERWFCVATADPDGPRRQGSRLDQSARHPGSGPVRAATADTDGERRELIGVGGLLDGERPTPRHDPDRCTRETFGVYAEGVDRWAGIIGRPAPAPTVDDRLNPAMVEWMMGLPAGWVTDCGLSRPQALRVLGNGVVPQQAAAAIRLLVAS